MQQPLKTFLHALAALALIAPAAAMVGGAPESTNGIGASVITIVGSRGNFCSGALIAPDLVLTAAHCLRGNTDTKIVLYDANRTPMLRDVRRVAWHPQFNPQGIAARRASADVALLQLTQPLSMPVAALGIPLEPIAAGQSFTIAGIGVTRPGDGKSGGVVRAATLMSTSQPGRLQIRLVDPANGGLGACTGDSGGPVVQQQAGIAKIVGVVSWSTGPNNTAGCGGLSGVTPLTLYRDWVVQTARGWGVGL
jgi:secreted trypsin-like serine protease